MKKTIITLLFLILTFGLCADTGYNKIEWGRKRDSINFGENVSDWELENLYMVSFKTIILGDTSIKTYFFEPNKGFQCVSYYIPANTVQELISKFDPKKKVYEIKTELFNNNDITETVTELINAGVTPSYYDGTNESKEVMTIIMSEIFTYELASITEEKGYKTNKEVTTGPRVGTLYIYDYNDDTRVYIARVEDKAFVAYVPHYQDY